MASVTVTLVEDLGDDVLRVTGTGPDGAELVATGWVSAMTNYFPASSYAADGSLKPTAAPKSMTAAQQKTYWLGLLAEVWSAANPDVTAAPTVLFQA